MKNTNINKILIIGSGPIVIGQACEFDYSGTQACKALKADGFQVVLVNSNPATIMTDPSIADATYIEPLTIEVLDKIIQKERPDALLPTLGGQTALNLAIQLHKEGVLEKYKVQMIGAQPSSIHKAEDRSEFKKAMSRIGLESAHSEIAQDLDQARKFAQKIGYPCVIRPAYTLGGIGGGIVNNEQQLDDIVASGLRNSLISEVLIEECLLGWKEYELEVMRDCKDNVVIVCSIENIDPMGVHTGDSVTVAPAQTLTDKEYQKLRNASIAIMREIGVATGGSNVQFAINPHNGRMIVIEMNPRVSRSSALASKATGFPIAKIAALLAVGYSLDEIRNDITQETPASFEPTIDYVVTKIPRFTFSKFPNTHDSLGTAMQSVGEVMAIGRTFRESLQKAMQSLEINNEEKKLYLSIKDISEYELIKKLRTANSKRLFYIKAGFENGLSIHKIHEYTKIDYWFLQQIKKIVDHAHTVTDNKESILHAKQMGFSDKKLAKILQYSSEQEFRTRRDSLDIKPVYKLVDTCAGEFSAMTPYFYSTYEIEDEVSVSLRKKIMILGSGPNRIGQGIEFDYCCVHAAYASKNMNIESIMVNSNPETVSTDFDTSDKLYFEPLTFEHVFNIYCKEKPEGIIVQFGGQTPLNLSRQLEKAGAKILGTSPQSIDRAEDRKKFAELLKKLDLKQARNATVHSFDEAMEIAKVLTFPIIVRPSYVLGGASMKICYSDRELSRYIKKSPNVSNDHPILIDQFLKDAIEIDVDALCDSQSCIIAGIMEHIERTGIHSGDSACSLPPFSLDEKVIQRIKDSTKKIALELKIKGLINIQFALFQQEIYVIEVNPRASRTIPFVSKATGIAWAQLATQVMLGVSISQLGIQEPKLEHWSIKEAILPFNRFPQEDPILGPEMRSTGEVMGIDQDFAMAFYKSQQSAGMTLPHEGHICIYFSPQNMREAEELEMEFLELGFHSAIIDETTPWDEIEDIFHEQNPLLLFSFESHYASRNESDTRKFAIKKNIPIVTTLQAAGLIIKAIKAKKEQNINVRALQHYNTAHSSASFSHEPFLRNSGHEFA